MSFTVALIGPDGAGKTTVCRRLQEQCPLPIAYVYMGVSRDSSNCMLPTTRLIRLWRRLRGARRDNAGPRDPREVAAREHSGGAIRRAGRFVRSLAGLANRVAEEWYRQLLAWYYQRLGRVVLFDRHFFSDYYAYDIAGDGRPRSLCRRIHGFMLDRLYPKPHLVVYLDASAEVLFARKGEGTLELLQQRRSDYLQLRNRVQRFVVVDAEQPLDSVTQEVVGHVVEFHRSRNPRARKAADEACTID